MSGLERIAYFQNRRDEIPNQELARALASKKSRDGIREIAENLRNDNAQIQSDCLKVLYEVGYLDPALIADYFAEFAKLLESKNNRLVWGSMIALSTIAKLKATEIFGCRKTIQQAMESGSVITIDNGVRTLALVASSDESRCKALFAYLLRHLENCRPKEVPQHSEKTLVAVTAANRKKFIQVLEKRIPQMSVAQATRVKQVIKQAQQL